MKNSILLFVLFVFQTALFPVLLSSQTFNYSNNYEIVKENQDDIYIQSTNQQINYLLQNITNRDNWDTLYISLDLPNPEIIVSGPFYNYLEYNFTMVTSTLMYILLNNEHQFQIGVRWKEFPDIFVVFEEDYSIDGTDTLEFSSLDAIYELEIQPLDQNGVIFNQLNGIESSEINIMIPQGVGYYAWQCLHYNEGTSYFSEISENFFIQCSSIFYDVEIDNYSCFIEFPLINGMNQNHILENMPEDYIHTNLQMYVTNENVDQTAVGFSWGIKYIDFRGEYYSFGGGVLHHVDSIEFWNGNMFLINQENAYFKNTVSLSSLTRKQSQIYTDCTTPNLEVINDSIGTYYSMLPPYNIYKAGNTDTLFFGETPTTFWLTWLNNTWGGNIAAFAGSYGIMREDIKPIDDFSFYKVKDWEGNIIFEGAGSSYILFNNPEPGNYTVEITNLSSPLNSGYGTSELISNFSFGAEDASPPTISPVQFRDILNKPTYRIGSGEQLALFFSAVDFNDHADSITGPIYFLYQPILDDSTKVFIKESRNENWMNVEIEKYYEDSISGYYYMADLSPYTNLDSTALDLKIKIRDYNDNSSIYVISPAILIDDFVITDIEAPLRESDDLGIGIYPNPATNRLTIQNNENIKISSITIMDATGKLIKQYNSSKSHIDISDIEQGVYFVKLIGGGKVLTKKIIIID